jgi:serine phosphatase RsbU (regulator of sigma subunit)
MPSDDIQSEAFKQARSRSERFRILGILGFVAVLWLVSIIRVMYLHGGSHTGMWLRGSLMAGLFAVYELVMLWAVRRAANAGRDLPSGVWMLNIIIETSLPAVSLAFLGNAEIAAPYQPLASPAVLVFFLFIIMSTLRLDPRLCHLTGLVACVSYMAAAAFLGWDLSQLRAEPSAVAQTAVPMYAAILLIGGFVAGGVAGEIRKHVQAALREAEVRTEVERLRRDMDIARSIQQGLLPAAAPRIEGFEIAGWSQPADRTGGDYFDWQGLPDGRQVVMVADVTGHGLGPALLAAVCRAYARASFGLGEDLRTSMERINRALMADLSEGRFVTFVAAVCRPGSGHVQLLSAGHGPMFVYHFKGGAAHEMRAQAMPLGIVPELASDPPLELDLGAGDMIVLATDGFFDWSNAEGEQFGTARLARAIRAAGALPPQQIIATLYDAVVEFTDGTPQKDDVTAVIIKRADAARGSHGAR